MDLINQIDGFDLWSWISSEVIISDKQSWDFDQRMMDYVISQVKRKFNEDVSKDKRAIQRIRKEIKNGTFKIYKKYSLIYDIESKIATLAYTDERCL